MTDNKIVNMMMMMTSMKKKMMIMICLCVVFVVVVCDDKDYKRYESSLFYHVRNGHVEVVEDLLSNDDIAPENAVNIQEHDTLQTPVMAATLAGQAEVVKVLLSRNCDTNIAEKDGYTPMHGAGFQGRAEIATILAQHGLDVNHVHSDGHRPIHRACWGDEHRHADTVDALISAGADMNALDANGRTPLDVAKRTGNQHTVRVLMKHGAYLSKEL